MTTKVTSGVLENTAVVSGSYGGTTQHAVVSIDAQGRIVYAANATPSIATSQLTGTISAAQLASGVAVTNIGYTPYNSTNPSGYITASSNENTRISSLGVGTPASGTTGEIRATSEVTAYYSSDKNLKENITTITDALDKLKQIKGVMFDWKDEVIEKRGGTDEYFVRKHDTGIIAQDVEKVLPEVVAERPDGTKAVRYEKMAGLIIQAINELSDKVDELGKKIK